MGSWGESEGVVTIADEKERKIRDHYPDYLYLSNTPSTNEVLDLVPCNLAAAQSAYLTYCTVIRSNLAFGLLDRLPCHLAVVTSVHA
jgi:hypothetical protein